MRIARIVGILQANEFASNLRTNSTHPPCLHVWNGVVLVSSEAAGVPSLEDCRGFRSNRQHRQLEKVVFTSALFRSPRTATRTLDKPCLAHSLRRRLLAQAPPVTVHQGIINLRHRSTKRQKDAKGAGSRKAADLHSIRPNALNTSSSFCF